MSTQKIATSTLWQIASQCTMAALSILTVKLVAMGLSKELFGNYNSAYGYLQLFGILADFGLYAVAVREVSKAKNRSEVLGALIILRCIILAVSLGAALLFAFLLPTWRGTPLPLGILIASLVPFFTLLAGILRTVFQVHYKMQYVFIAEVTQRVITAGLMVLFIVLGIRSSTDLTVYYFFLLIGGIGAFALFLLSFVYANRMEKIQLRFEKELILDLAKKAAPFGIAYLCMALYRQFDVTLIAVLRPDFELQNAYYGPIIRMMDMAFLLPTFLLNSALPVLSERDGKGQDTKSLLGKTFVAIVLIGVIAALFSFIWSRPLVHLLTTESYLSTALRPGSDTALRLLATPMLMNGIILFGFYILLTKHAWRELVTVLVMGAVLSIGLNLFFIPTYGFVGASYTSIIVNILLACAFLPLSLRAMPLKIEAAQWTRALLFAVLLAVFLELTAPFLQTEWLTLGALILATLFMGGTAWVLKLPQALGLMAGPPPRGVKG